jgi:hypothetical protein
LQRGSGQGLIKPAINMKTANTFAFLSNRLLLARADDVIE